MVNINTKNYSVANTERLVQSLTLFYAWHKLF